VTPEETSAAGADNERWLTYLEYDRNVQQAVKRLGALSSHNVDEFRALLLKGRDRSRIQEYEADSIRRLQGEAFVGDEELQRALIVLNAEDPRLGDELKKLVSTRGRPGDLDQAVAAIRGQKESPAQSSQAKVKDPTSRAAPAPTLSAPALSQPAPSEPIHLESVRAKIEERKQTPVDSQHLKPQQIHQPSRTKRFALLGAVFVVGAAGLVFMLYRQDTTQKIPGVTVAPPLRAAADEKRILPPAVPKQVAQQPAQHDIDDASVDDQAARPKPDKVSPPSDVADPSTSNVPVPGARYKVVRGDMLSDIALQAYGDASKYTLIQKANPSLRNRPNRIFSDQVIYLPPVP
jgi:nucleoid-associated protein YgaU